MNNKRASVLMISLWVLALLVLFAVGLGRSTSLNLKMAGFQRDSLRARLAAGSGINQTISLLQSSEFKTKDFDTLAECGVVLNGKISQELFSGQTVSDRDSFKVGYYASDGFVYGITDEERRININPAGVTDDFDKQKLIGLFESKNLPLPEKLAQAILDWVNPVDASGAVKRQNFKIPEQLLLVFEKYYRDTANMEPDEAFNQAHASYDLIKDWITVYGDGRININTASDDVIKISCRAMAKVKSITDPVVAEGVAGELIGLKENGGVDEDKEIDITAVADSPGRNLFTDLKPGLKVKSDYFRIKSSGQSRKASSELELVYSQSEKRIVYWQGYAIIN